MSLEDRYYDIMNDPKKRGRLFKIAWLAAYSMLILGSFIVVWALLYL